MTYKKERLEHRHTWSKDYVKTQEEYAIYKPETDLRRNPL